MNFDVTFCKSCNDEVIKMTFQVLQGSLVTYLRCDGKHDKGFIANFFLNPQVKEFWNLASIWQSYEQIILWVFFDSQCMSL